LPKESRIDAAGASHHVMVGGIERRKTGPLPISTAMRWLLTDYAVEEDLSRVLQAEEGSVSFR
jgi:hypothetical protein